MTIIGGWSPRKKATNPYRFPMNLIIPHKINTLFFVSLDEPHTWQVYEMLSFWIHIFTLIMLMFMLNLSGVHLTWNSHNRVSRKKNLPWLAASETESKIHVNSISNDSIASKIPMFLSLILIPLNRMSDSTISCNPTVNWILWTWKSMKSTITPELMFCSALLNNTSVLLQFQSHLFLWAGKSEIKL